MTVPGIDELLAEYERALAHTDGLWTDLTVDELGWRPDADSSAIGWHLLHQPAVAHFMVRNLTVAEPRVDAELERLGDSATPPRERGDLPDAERIATFRGIVADRVRSNLRAVADGDVGPPAQLVVVGRTLLTAVVNHEYQHATWIAEVRSGPLDRPVPDPPTSSLLTMLDGYPIVVPFD
ncbi:MAG: DinB family protein [Acidimicrobiia bacterium]|nr:DinB family protein [Acidimicrobiia bacterium]